ncbi:MAG: tetratricopeptide repeat protein [Candidatus Eremiobacteraeota bacterium]|nr:tetratricopeptide repeat protein [Candidatus Eremiobacteraeota bacterium]
MTEIEELLSMGEDFLLRNGKVGALRIFERALKISLDNLDFKSGAKAHLEIGKIMLEKKRARLAGENFKWAAALYKKVMDRRSFGYAAFYLGKSYSLQGKYQKSKKPFETALKIINPDESPEIVAELHYCLGRIYMEVFGLDRAFEHLNQAQKLFQKTQNRKGAADAFFDQGNLFFKAGDFNVAREYFNRSLIIYGEIQSETKMAEACLKLGAILIKDKNFGGAEKLFKSALEKFLRNDKILRCAETSSLLADLYIKGKEWNKAQEILKKAIKLYLELDTPQKLADAYYNMTIVMKETGQNQEEYKNLLYALENYMLAGSHRDGMKILEELGKTCMRDGNLKEARHYFLEAIDLNEARKINIDISHINDSVERIDKKLKKVDDIALNKKRNKINLDFI